MIVKMFKPQFAPLRGGPNTTTRARSKNMSSNEHGAKIMCYLRPHANSALGMKEYWKEIMEDAKRIWPIWIIAAVCLLCWIFGVKK